MTINILFIYSLLVNSHVLFTFLNWDGTKLAIYLVTAHAHYLVSVTLLKPAFRQSVIQVFNQVPFKNWIFKKQLLSEDEYFH